MKSPESIAAPPQGSLFDDVVYRTARLTKDELEHARQDPKSIAMPLLRLVLADWRIVLKYMTAILGKIEWEFEMPHWGEKPSDVDNSLRKLSPWRRNIPYYQDMIAEAIQRVFPPLYRSGMVGSEHSSPTTSLGRPCLLPDFQRVQQLMDASQRRIETIQSMASNSINIEESRRAVDQNTNLARLTGLATFFIPLNFTSSFLSMSPDFSKATMTIWMFFAIGFPLTAIALVTVDLWSTEGYLRKVWVGTTPRLQPSAVTQQYAKGQTINWQDYNDKSKANGNPRHSVRGG